MRPSTAHEHVRRAYADSAELYIELLDRMTVGDDDVAFVRRHLTGIDGTVLDLGCGPGQWSAYLHSLGVDVVGVDIVEEFIEHARTHHPGPEFRRGSLTDRDLPGPAAGVLAWFSTIHLTPSELGPALAGFREVLKPRGRLVVGFFDSDHGVAEFQHKVTTAWRYPVEAMADRLQQAGFTEVERFQWSLPDRPARRYAAVAAQPQE
jgi:SAM-dependent methyltransferase